jgi:hypothetical protein
MMQQHVPPKSPKRLESSVPQLVEFIYIIWMNFWLKMADKSVAVPLQRVFEQQPYFAIRYCLTSAGWTVNYMKEMAFGLECSPALACTVGVCQSESAQRCYPLVSRDLRNCAFLGWQLTLAQSVQSTISRVRIPVRVTSLSFLQNDQTLYGAHRAIYSVGTGVFFLWVSV